MTKKTTTTKGTKRGRPKKVATTTANTAARPLATVTPIGKAASAPEPYEWRALREAQAELCRWQDELEGALRQQREIVDRTKRWDRRMQEDKDLLHEAAAYLRGAAEALDDGSYSSEQYTNDLDDVADALDSLAEYFAQVSEEKAA
jgi:hypothetical protein